MNCVTGFVKYLIFFTNLIMALAALTLVGFGLFLNFEFIRVPEFFNKFTLLVTYFAITVTIAGIIFFIIAAFGCGGAIVEKRSLIITYAIILLVILIAEIIVGGYSYWTVENMKGLSNGSKKNFQSQVELLKLQNITQTIQYSEKCCGIFGADDYVIDNDSSIPSTCCPVITTAEVVCHKKNAYEKGCLAALGEKHGSIVLITLITIGMTQIVFIILSLCLAVGVKNSTGKGLIAERAI